MRISLIVLMFVLVSCSTHKKEKKEIEQEASQTQVKDSQTLGTSIHDLINNSKTLSDVQKKELTDILALNKSRAQELSAESYKYRGVLVQELLTGKATDSRIKILEGDIERVEKLRLQNTFETVKKISAIVSKQPEGHKEFAEKMINIESPGSAVR
ncbi:MAG: hypothetical protein ACJ76H_12145 [Bacteriovoracaceae bacterium]